MMMPTIILKLDDVTRDHAPPGRPVSARWERCVDALRTLGVPAALGVIGYSLEGDAPDYFDWSRALADEGVAEFWNHGYACRASADAIGEFERSLPEQIAALQRTQQLGIEKLGLTFRAFGPHWSGTNAATDAALAAVPELQIVFDRPRSPGGSQTVLRRHVELERPIFVPNAAALLRDIDGTNDRCTDGLSRRHDYLTLQGHPPAWDDAALAEFVVAMRGLLDRGCRFTTPSQFLAEASNQSDVTVNWTIGAQVL